MNKRNYSDLVGFPLSSRALRYRYSYLNPRNIKPILIQLISYNKKKYISYCITFIPQAQIGSYP